MVRNHIKKIIFGLFRAFWAVWYLVFGNLRRRRIRTSEYSTANELNLFEINYL